VGGIRTLASARLDQLTVLPPHQQAIKQPTLGPVLDQPGAKLAQHGEVKAGIVQFQTQQVFPVNAATYSIGRGTIRESFNELQSRDKGQTKRSQRGLTLCRKKISKVLILKKRA
jgi:hypothetical protein